MKYKRSIVFLINLIMITGLFTTSFVSYFVSIQSAREEILKKQLPITSDNVYTEVQNDLLRPIIISSLMASDTFLRDWVIKGEKDELQMRKYLKEVQKKYSVFTSFFVSEETNTYYHSSGILKKISSDSDRDLWYFRVRNMKENYETNVDPDMANKDYLTIFINYKVYDYNGKFIGVTGVGLNVDTVKEFIENHQKKYKSRICFVDKDGVIKLSSFKSDNNVINVRDIPGLKTIADRIFTSNSKELSYKDGRNSILVNSRYIPELKWYLIVEQSDESASKRLLPTLILNLIICVVITIFVSAVIYAVITKYQNELEKMATIDKLTNVYNRQAFDIAISSAIKEYRRYEQPFSMVIFDIDNFKNINDTYGHTAGDNVIQTVAAVTRSVIRESDSVFRWGGDEFVILFKNCGIDNAFNIAEKVKTAVSDMEFIENGLHFSVSISLGVVEYIKDETEDDVLKRADRLLYCSKQNGKNRVER